MGTEIACGILKNTKLAAATSTIVYRAITKTKNFQKMCTEVSSGTVIAERINPQWQIRELGGLYFLR